MYRIKQANQLRRLSTLSTAWLKPGKTVARRREKCVIVVIVHLSFCCSLIKEYQKQKSDDKNISKCTTWSELCVGSKQPRSLRNRLISEAKQTTTTKLSFVRHWRNEIMWSESSLILLQGEKPRDYLWHQSKKSSGWWDPPSHLYRCLGPFYVWVHIMMNSWYKMKILFKYTKSNVILMNACYQVVFCNLFLFKINRLLVS